MEDLSFLKNIEMIDDNLLVSDLSQMQDMNHVQDTNQTQDSDVDQGMQLWKEQGQIGRHHSKQINQPKKTKDVA